MTCHMTACVYTSETPLTVCLLEVSLERELAGFGYTAASSQKTDFSALQ